MELRGDDFVLRPWRMDDAAALVKHGNNRAVWRNLGERFPHPYTDAAAQAWLSEVVAKDGPTRIFAIDIGGEAAGSMGIHPGAGERAKMAVIGYWLGQAHWGRGIATRALRLVVDYAFVTFAFERLEASVYAWNPASARVLEKNGFTLEGRLRSRIYHDETLADELMYGLLREKRL